MPRTSRGRKGNPPSSREFVDREKYLEIFDSTLESLNRDQHCVLAYYGVGGIGKTALLKELSRRLEEKDSKGKAYASLNFEDSSARRSPTALIRLRNLLHDGHRIPFPSFDLVYATYWKLAHPELPLKQSELRFLEEGEVAGELVGLIEEAPVIGFLARIPRMAHKLSTTTQRWWRLRGHEQLSYLASETDPNEVAAWLSFFWGEDVREWLEDHPEQDIVLCLDTFEALWEGEGRDGPRGLPPDDWVRDWAGHLQGILLVVAGRSCLLWEEQDPTWHGRIKQFSIDDLSPPDCDALLIRSEVAEPEVREIIVKKSEGLPFYLDLAIDTYERIRDSDRGAPRREDFDSNLQQLLRRFLHYTSVEEEAALHILSVPKTFDQELYIALMTRFATGFPATRSGLRALRRFSFIKEPAPGRYALHDLLRQALASEQTQDERREVHSFLFENLDRSLRGVEAKRISEADRRAIVEAVTHGKEALEPGPFFKWYEENERPFYEAADWPLILPLRRRVLQYVRSRFGDEQQETLKAKSNLAAALHKLTEYREAEKRHREVLDMRARTLGPDHPSVLNSMTHLGNVLRAVGRFREAEELHRGVLDILTRTLDQDHPEVLSSMNNLANVLRGLGKLREAEELHRRILDLRSRTLAPDDPKLLNTANNLAVTLTIHGKFDEAEHLFRRVLDARERILTLEHPETLEVQSNLASVLNELGEWDEAEELNRRTLEARTRTLGPQHDATLISINNLANVLIKRGKLHEARELHRRVHDAREHTLRPDHPGVLGSKNNIARVLAKLGEFVEARDLNRLVHSARVRTLGPDHYDTLASKANLAQVLKELNEYGEAEKLCRETLDERERTLGPEHPHTLESKNTLTQILKEVGRLSEAEVLIRYVLDARERTLGPEHPDTLESRNTLAQVLVDGGRLGEAEEMCRLCLSAREQILGPEHPDTLESKYTLAQVLMGLGHVGKAESLFRHVVDERVRVLGPRHPDTLKALKRLEGCRRD